VTYPIIRLNTYELFKTHPQDELRSLDDNNRESDVVDLLRRLADELNPKSSGEEKDDSRREQAVEDEGNSNNKVEKLLNEELQQAASERKKYGSILIEHGVEQKVGLI
jgi:hypothetical protein